MESILLFALTTGIYYFIWFISTHQAHWTKHVKRIALVALLVLPLNINGNVFTIAGNAVAEKSVYSIFSIYQKAGQNAFTLIGLAYQKAGRNAITGIGLAGYQKAEQNAVIGLGIAGYQKAGQHTETLIAIALYQRVGEKTRAFGAFSALTNDYTR